MPIGRRVAAGAALLTVPAMVAVAVVALFGDPSGLVLALVLLAVAAGAAWLAATQRRLVRWLSVIAAAACVVGIAFVLTLGTGGIITLVAIGLLLAAFGACARYALGQPPRPGRRVPPARRGVLIINPKSGGGKAERFRLFDEAAQRGIETIELTPGSDLRALAEQAVAEGADVLGMAGGDGSQALVADVARAHDIPLVVVPAGTRNHFALDLGLDRADVVGALEAFGAARERRIDLGLIGDRVFVNNASLGVYAIVVQSEGYREAKLATAARMAPEMLGPDGHRADLRFLGPDGSEAPPTALVLISNGPYRMEGISGVGTRARLDAGVLGVVTLTVAASSDLPTLMAAQATGHLHGFHGYREWTTPEFVVDSGE